MSTELESLPDDKLSEVFAVEVAGWKEDSPYWTDERGGMVWNYENDMLGGPNFATSADSVLPFLDANTHAGWSGGQKLNFEHIVTISIDGESSITARGNSGFARIACIALILAKRHRNKFIA